MELNIKITLHESQDSKGQPDHVKTSQSLARLCNNIATIVADDKAATTLQMNVDGVRMA